MKSIIIKSLKKIKPLYKIYKSFIGWRNREEVRAFPDMDTKRHEILDITKEFINATIFIETGTYFGDTIEFFKNKFEKLYSIELSEELATKAVKRFSNERNIEIIQGNSSEKLLTILSQVKTQCVFWLDGHYSSEFWAGGKYIITARGKKITPILDELVHISNHFVDNHIILIDDARLFTGRHDYPSISKVKRIISRKFPLHSFDIKNDIIRILPRK